MEFQVRVEFVQKQMYHLVLEGNDPVAEGWHSTLRAGGQVYTVTMKPKAGRVLEAGKTYRLCIGMQNPQAVQAAAWTTRILLRGKIRGRSWLKN